MFSNLYIDAVRIENPANTDEYYFHLPVIKNLIKDGELKLNKPITFFVGENGTGKSTLLEAMAVAFGFNAEGGSRNFNFSTYESHSGLCNHVKLSKGIKRPKDGYFLRAESFYNAASYIEELDKQPSFSPPLIQSYGGKSLHDQSHGESFMSLILNRFGGNGLYILDEPEAALSPSRQFSLLAQMNNLVSQNSQFIIATHSPILLAFPDAEIYTFSETGLKKTIYEETEHYLLTKQFLNNPQRMLKILFENDNPDKE